MSKDKVMKSTELKPEAAPGSEAVLVCQVKDLKVGEARKFMVAGRAVCLVHCADGWRCIDDTCSHADYSLSEGEVDAEACEIECEQHGSLFSLMTGEPLTFPATVPVAVHDVIVDNDAVSVVLR